MENSPEKEPQKVDRHNVKLSGFRLETKHKELIDKMSKKHRTPKTEIVRWAVEYLAEQKFPEIWEESQRIEG